MDRWDELLTLSNIFLCIIGNGNLYLLTHVRSANIKAFSCLRGAKANFIDVDMCGLTLTNVRHLLFANIVKMLYMLQEEDFIKLLLIGLYLFFISRHF